MATSTRTWPDIAIPPSELLAETLETLGLSQAELARRAGRPAQTINEIIRGTKEITPETALQFERVLKVPAHVWTRLEADYRHNKARLEDQARLKHELPLVSRYPYPALAAHGWVRKTRDALERLEEPSALRGRLTQAGPDDRSCRVPPISEGQRLPRSPGRLAPSGRAGGAVTPRSQVRTLRRWRLRCQSSGR